MNYNTAIGNPAPVGMEAEPADMFEYYYDEENNGICLNGYTGSKTIIKIPDTIDGKPVVGINEHCFGLVSEVYYPPTVKYFNWGFDLHWGWYDKKFRSKLRSLTELSVPKGVTYICMDGFWGLKSIEKVIIPDSITTIGTAAFECCTSLRSVNIPKNVISIDEAAFASCSSLESITVDKENPVYSDIDGVLFNKTQTQLLVFPNAKTDAYVIPASVTEIAEESFGNCDALKSIVIPDGTVSIGTGAFSGCKSLESVTIPDGVTTIEDSAFGGCKSLKSVVIPDSVSTIGRYSFSWNCQELLTDKIGSL